MAASGQPRPPAAAARPPAPLPRAGRRRPQPWFIQGGRSGLRARPSSPRRPCAAAGATARRSTKTAPVSFVWWHGVSRLLLSLPTASVIAVGSAAAVRNGQRRGRPVMVRGASRGRSKGRLGTVAPSSKERMGVGALGTLEVVRQGRAVEIGQASKHPPGRATSARERGRLHRSSDRRLWGEQRRRRPKIVGLRLSFASARRRTVVGQGSGRNVLLTRAPATAPAEEAGSTQTARALLAKRGALAAGAATTPPHLRDELGLWRGPPPPTSRRLVAQGDCRLAELHLAASRSGSTPTSPVARVI